MTAVFADSYYFIALISQDDADHDRVLDFAKTFHAPMVTTEFVLVEVADALATERWRAGIRSFVQLMRTLPSVEIVPVSSALLDAGLALYADRLDKEWSLTDCISFVVMRQMRIHEALTHDHHFRQAGFRALL